eukprot:sb/3478978/
MDASIVFSVKKIAGVLNFGVSTATYLVCEVKYRQISKTTKNERKRVCYLWLLDLGAHCAVRTPKCNNLSFSHFWLFFICHVTDKVETPKFGTPTIF